MGMRKAKIVCTIGPATESPELLDQLIASGMNVARLNFSHGSHESHGRAIKAIRAAAARRHVAVAIIQDLQGPRIRVGPVPAGGIELAPGDRVRLLAGEGEARTRGADHEIPVTYPHLALDVRPGAGILIDDGLVELTVTRIGPGVVDCAVVTGGRVTAHKGINLPGTRITAPTVTDKDLDDLQFGLTQGVDYVALSFVRAPEDVAAAKKIIAESGADVPVIAKVERPEAIACLESLLDQADGVMIARGDLGVEMGPEAVPVLQKRIIVEGHRRRRASGGPDRRVRSAAASPEADGGEEGGGRPHGDATRAGGRPGPRGGAPSAATGPRSQAARKRDPVGTPDGAARGTQPH